jgi:FdhD protein
MLEPVSRVTVRTPVRRFHNGVFSSRPDVVAGEEPLEIRIGGRSLTVTMRTPGHDIELVHGFLHAEGLISAVDDISEIRYCDGVDDKGRNTYNVLDITLSPAATSPTAASPAAIPARSFTTTSACGVCGTASIEGLQRRMRYRLTDLPAFAPATIIALPDRLRARQQAFKTTGGVHAAALVNPDGQLDHLREDVGRHNAVDKVIGTALMAHELPISGRALLTSSRASFELVQKAAMAGIGMLVAVSAPSSLAVQLAEETGLTLIGFTSAAGFNIYSGARRVRGSAG